MFLWFLIAHCQPLFKQTQRQWDDKSYNLWTHFAFEFVTRTIASSHAASEAMRFYGSLGDTHTMTMATTKLTVKVNEYDNKQPKVTSFWFIALLPCKEFN